MFEPDIQKMKLDDIRKLQEERLVKMARYAYDNVPMFNKRFNEAGITPDDIKGLDALQKIPFTVKDDLRQCY